MSEIDLVQALGVSLNLGYTTATWWLTVSTAIVVATYFAGRHIPPWLMGVTLMLYVLTAASCILELVDYSHMAEDYAARLVALHVHHEQAFGFGRVVGGLNSFVNYAILALGSLSAASYSFVTWRGARHEALAKE